MYTVNIRTIGEAAFSVFRLVSSLDRVSNMFGVTPPDVARYSNIYGVGVWVGARISGIGSEGEKLASIVP